MTRGRRASSWATQGYRGGAMNKSRLRILRKKIVDLSTMTP
jgi:hypothetical protein